VGIGLKPMPTRKSIAAEIVAWARRFAPSPKRSRFGFAQAGAFRAFAHPTLLKTPARLPSHRKPLFFIHFGRSFGARPARH
jgi:hypothetical protein